VTLTRTTLNLAVLRKKIQAQTERSGSSFPLPRFAQCRMLASGWRGTHAPRPGSVARSRPNITDMMQIAKQLAIFLDNRPGTLARVCDALSAAKINIYAITTSDTVDHSVIRVVVSDPQKAVAVFEEHGTLVVEDDVVMLEGDNKSGSLARIAHKLAGAEINIEYCYCATSPNATKGLLILRVSNPKKALKVLNS
jgi:hypothetical protein